MLTYIIQLLQALNANSKPSQIANSFCIGLILGLMPKDNLLWIIMFVFFMFVRINKAGYFIMMIIASCLAFLTDPLFDKIGYVVLTFVPLENFYAWLLDVPFVGFTKFNNTIVAGSLVCGIVCYVPLFVLMILAVKAWRKWIAPKFNDSKILKTIYKIPLIGNLTQKITEAM